MILNWVSYISILGLLGAAAYLGYVGYPITTILILAPFCLVLHIMPIPPAFSSGWKEHGLKYVLTILIGHIFICSIPFFVGRLAASIL